MLRFERSYVFMAKMVTDIFSKGVFLVTTIIAFIPIEHVLSMNTDSGISTVPRGSERSE